MRTGHIPLILKCPSCTASRVFILPLPLLLEQTELKSCETSHVGATALNPHIIPERDILIQQSLCCKCMHSLAYLMCKFAVCWLLGSFRAPCPLKTMPLGPKSQSISLASAQIRRLHSCPAHLMSFPLEDLKL